MSHIVRMLGTIEIEIAGEPAPAAAYRARKVALLAYLILNARPVRRLEIATLLWPRVDEKRARGSLNQLLVELRREYGADAFAARCDDEITVGPTFFTCDVTTLQEQAAAGLHHAAVAEYGGEVLAGFTLPGADEFNDWLDQQRQRVRDIVSDSAWHCAVGAAEPATAVDALRLCAELRPYDEAVLRARMQNAAALGNIAEAAALYEKHKARIAEELGLAPSPETRKLLFTLCSPGTESEQLVIDRVAAHLETLPSRAAAVYTARSPRSTTAWPGRHVARAAAACLLFFAWFGITKTTRDTATPPVNVALMSFGDQTDPAIRALPGLVATYLIRDSAVEVGYAAPADERYEVTANLQADADVLTGTLEIRSGSGTVIATTPLHTSTRVGMDTVAAHIAQLVATAVHPQGVSLRRDLALSTAQQHLLFARADFARGAAQNARLELSRAALRLDSVPAADRGDDWRDVRTAVLREQEWQMQAGLE